MTCVAASKHFRRHAVLECRFDGAIDVWQACIVSGHHFRHVISSGEQVAIQQRMNSLSRPRWHSAVRGSRRLRREERVRSECTHLRSRCAELCAHCASVRDPWPHIGTVCHHSNARSTECRIKVFRALPEPASVVLSRTLYGSARNMLTAQQRPRFVSQTYNQIWIFVPFTSVMCRTFRDRLSCPISKPCTYFASRIRAATRHGCTRPSDATMTMVQHVQKQC